MMRGVTNSGISRCGPWPTPGSTCIVSGPSTQSHIPFTEGFRKNGPLFP